MVTNHKISELSIATGVDFRFYKRFSLTFPNSLERTILSTVRLYHKIMMISKNNQIRSDFIHSKILGHCTAFRDDALPIANDLFDKAEILEFTKNHFVSFTENRHDAITNDILGISLISGRSFVIYQ